MKMLAQRDALVKQARSTFCIKKYNIYDIKGVLSCENEGRGIL